MLASKSAAKVRRLLGIKNTTTAVFCKKSHLRIQLFNHLNIETERTEAVVAADHRAQGIFHPAIIKVPFTSG
jgi:hypothetical protein